MKRMNCSIPIFFMVLVLILAVGSACKKAKPPAPLAPVAVSPKKDVPAAPEPVEDQEKVEEFTYVVPERNPFGSLLRVKKVTDVEIEVEKLTPLQRVAVTDMRVESIIVSSKRSVAHVITPDGKAHIVTVGTLMGRNKGKVVRMNSDEIIVEEQFVDYLERAFKQETPLRLRAKEGENL